MTVMKKIMILNMGLVFSIFLWGCAPKEMVRTDLKSLLENPEAYEDKMVVVTTDIKSLIENPMPYVHRLVEVSGFVEYGRKGFEWYFILKDEDGRGITCYERTYRNSPWIRADMAVRAAERENKKMIAAGILEKSKRIELDWIEWNGEYIDTDYKPETGLGWFRW